MCLCVLCIFKCWHSWGAVPIPVERKKKDQGAVTKQIRRAVATHLSDLLILRG